jgi:soluble lytic murein transglycosylase
MFSGVLVRCVLVTALLSAAAEARAAGVVVAALDPLAEARAAIRGARFEEAKAALTARGVDAPGLLGTALFALGDEAGACALYQADRTSVRGPAATLRAARCFDKTGDVSAALAAFTEVAAGPLAVDALVIDELAAFLDRVDVTAAVALARTLEVEVAPFDDQRREALGRALLVAVRRGDAQTSSRALEKIFLELSDTKAAQAASSLPQAAGRPDEDLAHALARATVLENRHASKAVLAALVPFVGDGSAVPLSALECEAHLLLGKSERKLRKYTAARRHLDAVARSSGTARGTASGRASATACAHDVRKRGAYLAARVAWLSNHGAAPVLLRAFADAWPNDALTDDVLLWLGDAQERAAAGSGNNATAERTWRTIIETHPSGDMIHEARFRLAWSRAQAGDAAGARAIFDDTARGAGARVAVSDRAIYWRARLALLPRLDSLEPTSDASARERATAELAAFAVSRPASWYGHLARLLVNGAGDKAPAMEVASHVRERATAASMSTSALLQHDKGFVLARALVDGGYDEEALILLGTLALPAAAEDRFALAVLIDRAGAAGGAHGFLRDAGLALLPGNPADDNALAWALNWPRVHGSAIVTAATEHALPPSLLFGLAREESAFDADVVSWAGAVGLCQLMPPTAADEARAKSLPVPDVAALKDPFLNARLGAAHLARRMKLGHPALAIAAYNAGPGAVALWSPRGPLDTWVEQIPVDETRNYVKMVTGSWVTYALLDGTVDDVAFPLVLP